MSHDHILIYSDIDECSEGNFTCHPYATCINTQGSYTCQCEDGFEKDGKKNCAGGKLFIKQNVYFSPSRILDYIMRHGKLWRDMIWYGMVWYGMVWYGMVWYGMVWYGMVWYGMVWYGMVWYGMVWYGMVWYGMVWYGMVWYGRLWYGMLWCGMVWC